MKLFSFNTLAVCALLAFTSAAQAQVPGADNPKQYEGAFTLIPLSAPEMVLEVIASGSVSINTPTKADNQKWVFTAKGDGYYTVAAGGSKDKVLTVDVPNPDRHNVPGVTTSADSGKDTQLWAVCKNPNGSLSLRPKSNPEKALDDFGGQKRPGSTQDIWGYRDDDEHLQWRLDPIK